MGTHLTISFPSNFEENLCAGCGNDVEYSNFGMISIKTLAERVGQGEEESGKGA